MPAGKLSGSPVEGEPVFLAVGKLHRPHGVKGVILMEVLTDFPERLLPGMTLFVGPQHQQFRLRSADWHDQLLAVSFDGFQDREQISQLRNQLVYVRADDRPPLPEGEYYHHQLLGLRVLDEQGVHLGVVSEILRTGANEVYVVHTPSGSDVLLPAIESVILGINLEDGEIRVHLLPGLLPEGPPAGSKPAGGSGRS